MSASRHQTRNLATGWFSLFGQPGRSIAATGDHVVVAGAIAEDMALERNAELSVD
jgi:hypothetical protein